MLYLPEAAWILYGSCVSAERRVLEKLPEFYNNPMPCKEWPAEENR